MTHKIQPVIAGATTLLLGASLAWAGESPPTAPAFSETAYRAHIERLSSDEFEGRAPGTEGEKKTLAYIEQQFRAAGLQPGIGDSFLQPVPVVEITTHPDDAMPIRGAKGSTALRYGDDMVVWTRQPVAESRIEEAELVFAGYGIVAPEYGWNDYAGLDMRGKIAVVLVNDPGFATQDPKLFSGNAMTYYGRWTYKYEEALRQGAAGLFVVHETRPAGYPWEVVRNGSASQIDLRIDDYAAQRLALEGWMTQEAAQRVLALAGEDYEQLKQAASDRKFRPRPLGVKASVGVRNEVKFSTTYNVVGVVPGSDRPDEYGPPRQDRGRGRQPRRHDLQRRVGQCHRHRRADRTRPCIRHDEAASGALGDVRRRDGRGIRTARQPAFRREPAGSGREHGRRAQHGQPLPDRQDA